MSNAICLQSLPIAWLVEIQPIRRVSTVAKIKTPKKRNLFVRFRAQPIWKQNQKVARRLCRLPSRNGSVITVIHQSANHHLNPFHALRRHCHSPYQVKAESKKICYQNSEGRPIVSRCVSISYVTSPQLNSTRIRYGHCAKLFTSFFPQWNTFYISYFLVKLHGSTVKPRFKRPRFKRNPYLRE